MSALLSETEALARVLAGVPTLSSECVRLDEAAGRYCAAELRARVALPGFDNSAMDGYALARRTDGEGVGYSAGTIFTVIGEQPAGRSKGLRLQTASAEAVRVFTGATLPEETGAVVMQEEVRRVGEQLTLLADVAPGEFIRRAGGDVCRGQRLLAAGERLTAPALALCASQGLAEIEVGRAPRVAILTTGDELRPPGEAASLAAGEIFESNGILLEILAAEIAGSQNVIRLTHAPDEVAALDAELQRGLGEEFDALIIAGGVSVGERDLVKARLQAAGVQLDLWRVAVKPGKPFVYGRGPAVNGAAGVQVFGLPGNPVSAFVTFLLFVRPALLKMAGANAAERTLPTVRAVAAAPLRNPGDRPHYLRGNVDSRGRFQAAGTQESHALGALARTRALARLEAGAQVAAGADLPVLLWAS